MGNEFEFFNLAENLAFNGNPEIPVLYANSPNTNVFDVIEKLHRAILILDEKEVSSDYIERIKLLAEKNPSLKILVISDKEKPELLSQISSQIIEWQTSASLNISRLDSSQTFTVKSTYFPTWQAANQNIFLDGYGRIVVYNSNENLAWKSGLVNFVSVIFFICGIFTLCLLALWAKSD